MILVLSFLKHHSFSNLLERLAEVADRRSFRAIETACSRRLSARPCQSDPFANGPVQRPVECEEGDVARLERGKATGSR
jgi:hypothetical protein